MIAPGLYDRMSKAGEVNLNIDKSQEFYVFIYADLLNGCEFSCSGCYVNKGINSKNLEVDLSVLSKLVSDINSSPFHMEEVAIGPTDFFSAKNAEALISSSQFSDLFQDKRTKMVVISTLQSSSERIQEIISLLEERLPHLDIDLLIPIDVDKMLSESTALETLKEKWKIIENSKLLFDPSFQINVCETSFLDQDPENLVKLAQIVRSEFDTILEFNPSVLGRKRNTAEILSYWNNVVSQNFKDSNLVYTMLNKGHTGANNLVVNFRRGEFYVCPFIYENVFIYDKTFQIPKKHSEYKLEDILSSKLSFFTKQMEYSKKTDDCADCEFLVSCSEKNVLTYMENKDVKSCFLNKMKGAS